MILAIECASLEGEMEIATIKYDYGNFLTQRFTLFPSEFAD
jgi:hypothetical protein